MDRPIARNTFTSLVASAYEHLYDVLFLRSHELTSALSPDPLMDTKERVWQLQQMLMGVIRDINPGPHAPALSLEVRRYQLMSLVYLEGLDSQAAADRLGISRRHFYRERDAAIEAIAGLLWQRYETTRRPSLAPVEAAPAQETGDHLQMLRLEAARLAQADRYARVHEVLAGAVAVLRERLRQQDIRVSLEAPTDLPEADINPGLLRQTTLTMLSFLVERATRGDLHICAHTAGENALLLTLALDPAATLRAVSQNEVEQCMAALAGLAQLGGMTVRQQECAGAFPGFAVQLPTVQQPTVLVVDDNADILDLFRHYLMSNGYRAVTTSLASEALALASATKPYAITLDIMMPEQDGWDVMQVLLNRPETHNIPIIICSVLQARELALSLGATTFLEKPVSEHSLIAALQRLVRA
jgi:CheY-like chemotaxis protein/predicted DNA-binding protein (UPF0251 family)